MMAVGHGDARDIGSRNAFASSPWLTMSGAGSSSALRSEQDAVTRREASLDFTLVGD
jgi:hypothetical protein